MSLQKKARNKACYEPSLKASSIRAYVEPILKLLIDNKIVDKLENPDKSDNLIKSSIIITIKIASNIVLNDLSNKKESRLLVK